jgi:hypothetical protein
VGLHTRPHGRTGPTRQAARLPTGAGVVRVAPGFGCVYMASLVINARRKHVLPGSIGSAGTTGAWRATYELLCTGWASCSCVTHPRETECVSCLSPQSLLMCVLLVCLPVCAHTGA